MRPVVRRKTTLKTVAAAEWQQYFKLALEHKERAEAAFAKRGWQSGATACIHATISLAEALLARHAGIKRSSESPGEIVYLLLRHLSAPQIQMMAKKMVAILDYQTLTKFEGRIVGEGEGRDCWRLFEELFRWVETQLPKNVSAR